MWKDILDPDMRPLLLYHLLLMRRYKKPFPCSHVVHSSGQFGSIEFINLTCCEQPGHRLLGQLSNRACGIINRLTV